MVSDQLRKLAAELREKAAAYDEQKVVKCAQVLQAARALNILREKIHVR